MSDGIGCQTMNWCQRGRNAWTAATRVLFGAVLPCLPLGCAPSGENACPAGQEVINNTRETAIPLTLIDGVVTASGCLQPGGYAWYQLTVEQGSRMDIQLIHTGILAGEYGEWGPGGSHTGVGIGLGLGGGGSVTGDVSGTHYFSIGSFAGEGSFTLTVQIS